MLDCIPKMSSIDKWLIFSILEPEFIANIKIACVFGSSGNEALIVNKDDDVYALGSNCSGCLGLGDSHGSLEPRKGKEKQYFFYVTLLKCFKDNNLSCK